MARASAAPRPALVRARNDVVALAALDGVTFEREAIYGHIRRVLRHS
jgi:hypothetical protein